MLQQRSIALIGLSGVGKSTVGQKLALQLGWPLRDIDALVTQAAGRAMAEIFAQEGDSRFRELESAALHTALATAPCVVATGGGIVLRDENRALLRERAYIVWLDAPTPALAARLRAHSETRPLLVGDDPATALESLRAAREALYASIADLRIETVGRTVEAICEEILGAIEE